MLLNALATMLRATEHETLYISGAPGSGKSHLLMASCYAIDASGMSSAYLPLAALRELSPAVLQDLAHLDFIAIDDVQAIAGNKAWESGLFTFFNEARESGSGLLFSADCGPSSLDIELADLKSRLSWGAAYQLLPLDDNGKQALLIQHAKKRGLVLKPEAASYLISHCSRDINNLLDTLDKLDRASMAAQRKLTLPFVLNQLADLECLG